jgi:hypothetical protein
MWLALLALMEIQEEEIKRERTKNLTIAVY